MKKKTIMCFGTFDHLHPGHLSYFSQAKELGDYLIVIIARNSNVEKIKGKLPRQNEKRRLEAVQSVDIVDEARLGGEGDKFDIVRDVNPDVIAFGYDQVVDVDKLEKNFSQIKIVRLKPYKPEIYKSSLI